MALFMGDLVNLRQTRKNQRRAAAAAKADENRARFGQSKANRTLTAIRRAQAETALAGHKRVTPPAARDDGDGG